MSEHEIDRLLRSRLEQEASRIDPRPLHARIRETLRKEAAARAPRRKT